MKVLLIDDEESARRRLARLLSRYGGVEIVGEAQDGLEALDLQGTLSPDVMFLDIQMPQMDGFGVIRAISASSSPMPLIIFATSFDQHALAAFEANAIAYLLKPIEQLRLDTALERARRLMVCDTERAEDEERVQAVAGVVRRLQRIVGHKGHSVVLLHPEDILCFYMDGGVVKAKTTSDSFWVNYQLAQLEGGLDAETFFRARREVLVNLHNVKRIKPYDRGTFVLTLADAAETELVVSERQAKELRQRLPGL